MTERLKRAVIYSIALGPRFFKWKLLSLSWPNALLFLQLLIALVTMSAVKVSAISIGFLLVSLITNRVYFEEECLPSFEVLNCLLNLAASCVDDENEIPLKEIASFSAVHFALPSIPLIVLHSLVISVLWSMFSTNLSIFAVYAHRCISGCLYSVLAVQARCDLFCGGRLIWSSDPVSLLVHVPRGVCVVQYGCGAMLL